MADQPKPEKKRPGRPRKEIQRENVPRYGVVDMPSNFNAREPLLVNVFEFLYENPAMIRKIFTLYKQMEADIVRVRCETDYIKFHALNSTGKSDIYTVIHGDRVNLYYCEKPLEFGLPVKKIHKIMGCLRDEHSKIAIFTSRQYERQKIKIKLTDSIMDAESTYTVDMKPIEEYDWSVESKLWQEIFYPIRFNFPFKYFKRLISDFTALGDILRVEKQGRGNLRLSYHYRDNDGDQNTNYRDPALINLVSYIDDPCDIFSTSVKLEYVRTLSKALTSDKLTIAANICRNIIFTILLDQEESPQKYKYHDTERCVIKVITEIVDAKKDIID